MNASWWLALALLISCRPLLAQGQRSDRSAPQIVERGPHSRTVQTTFTETLPDGRTVMRTNRYVELMPGGHFRDPRTGQWTETKEEVRVLDDALVADQGPCQVIFNKSFETPGTLDINVNGRRWQAQLVGVAYTDFASGNSQLIAEPQAAPAALIRPNQVAYLDALRGPFRVDVVFNYEASGLEQFVILVEQPPAPADYQCNEETTFLEIWTEWIEAPELTKQVSIVRQESDPVRRALMAEPDITDESLDFGDGLCMPPGTVFPLAGNQLAPTGKDEVVALKNWLRIDGRTFLVERIAYSDVKAHLLRLPQAAAARVPRNAPVQAAPRTLLAGAHQIQRPFPPPRKQLAAVKAPAPLQVAQVSLPKQGLVCDWALLNSLTNATLAAGTTYYVSNKTVLFTGTTRLEGCCVKFSTNSSVNRLVFNGPIDCATAPGAPMYLTGQDDNSAGEVIPNSTGNMGTNRYSINPMILNAANTTYTLHDLRFRNCVRALTAAASGQRYTLSHSQIGQADVGLYHSGGSIIGYLRNVLVHDTLTGFMLVNTTNSVEHATFHRVKDFRNTTNSGLVSVTNSLLICTTNNVLFTGDWANVVTNHDDSGIFTTLGKGMRYLATDQYRNVGTTNIDPTLAAERKRLSNWPPLLLTNNITLDTVLYPQAQRDTDTPDLGYAYDALDFLLSGVSLSATLTLTNGVGVGVYGGTGLFLQSGAKLISGGTPENMNRICPYYVVQEGASVWDAPFAKLASLSGLMSTYPEVDLRFSEVSLLCQSNSAPLFVDTSTLGLSRLALRDSRVVGGSFSLNPGSFAPALIPVGLTNNIFEAGTWSFTQGDYGTGNYLDLHLHNNLFYRGALALVIYDSSVPWFAHENFFCTNNLTSPSYPVTNSHNGYYATPTLASTWGTNKTITTAAFETGWLGRYYYPTNAGGGSLTDLVNAGSRTAATAGLAHFTTATNQTLDASTVDAGSHFVAVNAFGLPLDQDGDGLADWLEDADGDAVADGGETHWQTYNSKYGLTGSPGLQVFTPLK